MLPANDTTARPLFSANDATDLEARAAAAARFQTARAAFEASPQGQAEAAYHASHRWQGDLWQDGRDLAEVAKLVRADLKAAGFVASVRVSRYSMGQSLIVRLTPPAGLVLLSIRRMRQDLGLAPREPIACWRSKAASEILERVEAMVRRYNRSWSDRHQAFYADVDFADGHDRSEQREAIEAALRGAYSVARDERAGV